jgi:hypothetical protein
VLGTKGVAVVDEDSLEAVDDVVEWTEETNLIC